MSSTYYLGADSATDIRSILIPTTRSIVHQCRVAFILRKEKKIENGKWECCSGRWYLVVCVRKSIFLEHNKNMKKGVPRKNTKLKRNIGSDSLNWRRVAITHAIKQFCLFCYFFFFNKLDFLQNHTKTEMIRKKKCRKNHKSATKSFLSTLIFMPIKMCKFDDDTMKIKMSSAHAQPNRFFCSLICILSNQTASYENSANAFERRMR